MIFAAIADWAESKQYPVEFMCTQLEVSVSGYYAWRKRPVPERVRSDEALVRLIGMIFKRLKATRAYGGCMPSWPPSATGWPASGCGG